MATLKNESDEMFEMVTLDPYSWASQARLLKMSAQLSLNEITKLALKPRTSRLSSSDRSQHLLSFMQSYMMLSGFAIENVVKGLVICRLPKPRLLNEPSLKNIFHHNLHKLIVSTNVILSAEETDVVSRLQTFTIWAGRYPMPKEPNDYHGSVIDKKLTFREKDSELIDIIFYKFDRLILDENED